MGSRIRLPGPEHAPKNSPQPEPETEPAWIAAAHAAESKKAIDLAVLDLREVSSFTDYFVICSSANQRQAQAISDEVELRLKNAGVHPIGIEGYERAEWILLDYGEFIVHVLSESAREFYGLERLWRSATKVDVPPEAPVNPSSQ